MKNTRCFFAILPLLTPSLWASTSIGGNIIRPAGEGTYCYSYLNPGGNPPICNGSNVIIELAPAAGITVYLQNARALSGPYSTVDSSRTDSGGIFRFYPVLSDSGYYRISAAGQTIHDTAYSNDTGLAVTVRAGDSLTQNFILPYATSAVYSRNLQPDARMRFSVSGDRLLVEVGGSKAKRLLEIFSPKGSLEFSVFIPAGESQVYVPRAFAPQKGFLFRMN